VGYVQKPPGFPTDEFGTRAARWDAPGTAVTLLGTLGVAPNGEGLSDALAINSSGLIVGTSTKYNDEHGFSEFRAVYWRDAVTPVDLNALIDPASGWVLSHAWAVSDTGWIAGDGLFDPDGPGGQNAYGRRFLLQLPPQVDGDFNDDNVVDGADFLAWQRGESPEPLGAGDLAAWKSHFGGPSSAVTSSAVPEPAAHALCAMLLLGCTRLRRDRGLAQRAVGIIALLGNRIAQTVINRALSDGADEADSYSSPPGWEPVNDPLTFDLPRATMNDPNCCQPQALPGF
jgi:hypothetical protein